jgi:transcriptional regulator with PAS, ATPase and Fis domain/tetratricopeptide (TPR) repeat protein
VLIAASCRSTRRAPSRGKSDADPDARHFAGLAETAENRQLRRVRQFPVSAGAPGGTMTPGMLRQLQGESAAIAGVRKQVERLLRQAGGAARRLPPVLILGETGTGKGLLASAIHRASGRASGPFVDVNCAAIPETLLEAELFGFERGAFTDARQAKAGLFQTASGGTLFLDEIGLMPLALQSKLLKALEERSVRRLGGTRPEPVDVAIIAATSEDLSAAVQDGRFRQDLFHRLAVVTLVLPPLRRRGGDIVLLAEHFLARVCEDYGLPARVLADDARAALLAHEWPGNVRELSNVLERAVLLTDDTALTARHLGLSAGAPVASSSRSHGAATVEDDDAEEERRRLHDVLRQTAWNFTRAAVRLGMPRNTLRYRVERLGLSPESTPARRRGGRPPKERPAAAIVPPAPPPVRESRRVTLLQATLLARDEVVWDADRALEAIADKVRSFGGHVHAADATDLLAVFGREPEEDAPQRAAHAALALQKLGARARADDPRRAELAVALHAASLDVEGDTLLLDDEARSALRSLILASAPGTVVASPAAARLLGGRFDLAPVETSGDTRLIRVLRHAEPGRTRFVGRERELRLLVERFQRAESGEGQVVLIVGEPGIGKSRLLHELRRQLGSRATWVEGQALAFARSTPFHAVVDMLRRVLRIDDGDPEAVVIDKIERGIRRLAPDLDHVLPCVRYLLSVDAGDPAVAAMDPKQRHAAILGATHLLLERGAALRTHVIALEDVHWADAATEDWLARLAESVSGKRVLVLVTARPGYRASFGGRSFHTGLALSTLSSAESVQIARNLAGADELPAELQALVVDKAEGNPFFVEELMRSLHELAIVQRAGNAVALGASLDTTAVPDTIEEVILARVHRLDARLRRLLQVASVIGKDVPFALLRAVTGMPEDALAADLRLLLAAEFLLETRMYPELEHTFKHALTHEVAYGAVGAEERRALHARIVEAVERMYPERLHEHVERLAHHALRGELWPRAVRYSRQAGEKAFDRSANREAVAWWEQALAAIARLPEGEGARAAIDVRLALRSALLQLGEIRRITPYLREAEQLAIAAGDRGRLAWARAYITIAHLFAGEPREAVAVGEQAVALADVIPDVGLRATARTPLAHACREVGDYPRAIALFREAIDALTGDRLRQRLGQGMPPSLYARNMVAFCHAELGEFAQARRLASESESLAQPLDLPFGLVLARIALAYTDLLQERLAEASDVAGRALAVIETRDVPAWLPWVAAVRGYAQALSGRLPEGIASLELALARAVAVPFLFGHSQWLAWLAHAQRLAGRAEEAGRLAAEAVRTSRGRGERGYEAWALWIQGEVGGEPAAEASREALAIATELGMRPLIARCHLSLGARHRGVGDVARAREHFARAAEHFAALDMPAGVERASGIVSAP